METPDALQRMQSVSKDRTNAVWEELTGAATLVQSKKGRTCKSRVAANDSLCVDREGNRFESKRTVELAAPWEEGRLDDVELAREIDENTMDVERPLALLRTVVDEEKEWCSVGRSRTLSMTPRAGGF